MPVRRASATAQNIINPGSSRAHKSNDSNHSVSGPSMPAASIQTMPYSSSSLPTTPQQKVIYVLVNRIKNKLPCNSGIPLTEIENDEALAQVVESLVEMARDSLDVIGWALTELLEKLAKQTDTSGYRSVDVLQSQLFILKVLSICMASRWGRRQEETRPSSRNSKQLGSSSSRSVLSDPSARRRWQGSTDQLLVEPPPLDDNCAKYILSVMVLLLRQTAPPQHRLMSSASMDFAASHHDFESVDLLDVVSSVDIGSSVIVDYNPSLHPKTMLRRNHGSSTSLKSGTPSFVSHNSKHSAYYEKTSLVTSKSISSLNSLISKFTGRVIYHLSASNWLIVLSRVRAKFHSLAATATDNNNDTDIVDLQLMAHSSLDRVRLVQFLQELSSLLLGMRHEAQAAIAIPLRAAIWNWIDLCPDEYNDTIRHHRRMEGAPERVFDILYDSSDAQQKAVLWPTLAALASISSERLRADYAANSMGIPKGQHGRRDRNFTEMVMRHARNQSRYFEEALICSLDMCRAAFRVRPDDSGEIALHLTAHDVALDLKRILVSYGSSKPFWEYPDEIDVALIGDILVTIFRYLPEDESVPFFRQCLEPERSDAVKISAVKACITLTKDAAQCPWQPSLDKLKEALVPRVVGLLSTCFFRRSEVDKMGVMKRSALRPKAKRYTSETLPDNELLALSLLSLTRDDPMWFLLSLQDYEDEVTKLQNPIVESWRIALDPAIRLAEVRTFRSLYHLIERMSPEHPLFSVCCPWLEHSASAIFATVCSNLLDARTDFASQRMYINIAHDTLRDILREGVPDHIRRIHLSEERLPAFAIAEIAFLVSLTSADPHVTLMAAQCLRLLAQAETVPGAAVASGISEDERVKRYPIYEQLGDPKVTIVGRVGHQKRVRKLMRMMPSASPVHIAVWEECYFRWCALNEMTIRMSIDATADGFDGGVAPVGDKVLSMEERQAQWQNLTLFLAAFGSACIRDGVDHTDLFLSVAPEYLPDQLRILRDPAQLLAAFLADLIDLLVADVLHARDTARDALSSEASPRLYTRIYNELDNVVRQLVGSGSVDLDNLAIFIDQFLAILKVLIDNVQYLEEIRGMDLGSTLSIIAGFIGRFQDTMSFRLKLKFCALCESLFNQAETISIRKDSSNKQKIADVVIEWIQDASNCERDLAPQQRELNLSAFRTAVRLFDRLELQPPDGITGEEITHAISRLFIRYSNALFRTWDCTRSESLLTDDGSTDKSSVAGTRAIQRDGELRECVITGLVALLSANPEVGVKHTLPLAYEADPGKRVIFAYVFARVLPQGIALNADEQQPIMQRQSRLCELVKGPDMSLALAICEVCPASEVDSLISVLLNLFDTRSSLMTLLKNMIDLEVSRTDSDTSLFRGNSTCTRFLSAFANIYGYNYLRSLIIPLIKTMTSMPPGHGYDLDPAKVGEAAAKTNEANIKLVTSSFLKIILSSVPAVPPMLREICAHIAKVVNEIWPEAKFAAVGAFMFLRFISPAVVSPETIDIEVPKNDPVLRRGLMLVAKIIQNLANNIFFGKEAHMVPLNTFLKDNIVNVTKFLSELNKFPASGLEDEPEEWLDATYDDTDTIVLHRFFEKYADKVGKELLSLSKPPPEKVNQVDTTANGKRIWDALCAALVELGQPIEGPRIPTATTHEHPEYLELMSRYEHRDTRSVQDLFVEAIIPSPQARAIFVLSASRMDVEVLDIELLLFYIFKTLTSPANQDREFEIILDFTCFTLASQVPIQWLKFTIETIPSDIRGRFHVAHLLTPNALAMKYLRRLFALSPGVQVSCTYRSYSSTAELLQVFPAGMVANSLNYAVALEQEPSIPFTEVTMRHTHPMRVPVVLQVAQSHLRITTIKALPVGGSLTCKTTEIIPLVDINDVYNVSTGYETNEFIIRKIRHGITLYFSSPARDVIVKEIRIGKGNARPIQLPGTDRLSRFSNVVATLLHIGMLGVNSNEEEVRIAANELLQSVCIYLDFEGKPLITSKTSLLNGLPGPFLVQLSETLAGLAPHLTLDFISEVSTSMNRENVPDRVICVHYLAPWVKNLVHFTNPASKYYEPSTAKFRDCVRLLVDLTMVDNELHCLINKYIWHEIGKLDSAVVNAVLDELMRAAVDGGSGSMRCERVADTMGAISSINVRGRILSRIRKVIGKTSAKPTRGLADNMHWNEIACLTRLALVAGHHSKNVIQSQLYIPETVHVVLLTAGVGQTHERRAVYGLVVNLLNALYVARLVDSTASPEIQVLLNECEQPETLRLFGLARPTATSDYISFDTTNDKLQIDTLESLVQFLVRVLKTIAGSKGLLNVWRARWMSLITSSAFQLSPAVQTRAFISLGVLATSDVDDDLLYQMLVAFKTALSQSTENDTTAVVSMLRCIRDVTPHLPLHSRYLVLLFWLAVALVQSSHVVLYAEAIHLLYITVQTMHDTDMFREKGMVPTLLEGRAPLEEVACQLDHLLGLSFESNFSFSLSAIIFKGLRHSGLRDSAVKALQTLLQVTIQAHGPVEPTSEGPGSPLYQETLGYFLALIPVSTTNSAFKRLLEEAGVDPAWLAQDFLKIGSEESVSRIPFTLLGLADGNLALFVTSFVGTMLTTAQGDDMESQILFNILSDLADAFPDIVIITYESLQDKIREAFANSSSPVILSAVSNLFRIAVQDPERLYSGRGSTSTLSVDDATHGPGRSHLFALEEQGMQGLASTFQFLPPNQGHATKMINWISELVVKIIE